MRWKDCFPHCNGFHVRAFVHLKRYGVKTQNIQMHKRSCVWRFLTLKPENLNLKFNVYTKKRQVVRLPQFAFQVLRHGVKYHQFYQVMQAYMTSDLHKRRITKIFLIHTILQSPKSMIMWNCGQVVKAFYQSQWWG